MPIVMHMATHNTGSIFNICILNKAHFRHHRSMLPIIISSGMTITIYTLLNKSSRVLNYTFSAGSTKVRFEPQAAIKRF